MGFRNVAVENSVDMRFDSSDTKSCEDVECMRVRAESSVTPWARVGAFAVAAAGAGIDWGKIKAKIRVGVRGDLNLLNFDMPLTSKFLLDRGIIDQDRAIASVGAAMPDQLSSVVGSDASALAADVYHVAPSLARYHAPFAIGSDLGTADGINVRAQFLSGKLSLFAQLQAFFFNPKFETTLVSWNGIERQWRVADGATGNALSGRVGITVPNMVLLPKLELAETPGEDPTGAQASWVSALGTSQLPGHRDYLSHDESGLGRAWDVDSGRCGEKVIPF